MNGGSCVDGINWYNCDCTETGFVGVHCEQNIDDCINATCVNGGTCVDGIKDYSCQCFSGYGGKSSELLSFAFDSPVYRFYAVDALTGSSYE